MDKKKFLLPGLEQQIKFFLSEADVRDKSILVMGEGLSEAVHEIADRDVSEIVNIVEDQDQLMLTRLNLQGLLKASAKMMDYDNTDFSGNHFDYVYAQASISLSKRHRILKEIKRILKNDGILCVGELVYLENDVPVFVKDIWKNSNIEPLFIDNVKAYYQERGFELLETKNLSYTLKQYYEFTSRRLQTVYKDLDENELRYRKKLINKINHESNAFLTMKADRYTGFIAFTFKSI